MDDCIFCQIIAGEQPAYVIAENDRVIVFLSLENHPLVAPKTHIPNLYSLDEATGAAVIREAVVIAKALKKGLHCDGVFLAQANEPAAGQDVFHFHLHVYPRWRGDGMKIIAPAGNVSHEVKQQTQYTIRAALDDVHSGSTEGR